MAKVHFIFTIFMTQFKYILTVAQMSNLHIVGLVYIFDMPTNACLYRDKQR